MAVRKSATAARWGRGERVVPQHRAALRAPQGDPLHVDHGSGREFSGSASLAASSSRGHAPRAWRRPGRHARRSA